MNKFQMRLIKKKTEMPSIDDINKLMTLLVGDAAPPKFVIELNKLITRTENYEAENTEDREFLLLLLDKLRRLHLRTVLCLHVKEYDDKD